jgi:arginyl-tRNA synthetase
MGNDRPEARVLLANDPELTATRLYLADGIGQVIRNGLHLMGVEALEEMN